MFFVAVPPQLKIKTRDNNPVPECFDTRSVCNAKLWDVPITVTLTVMPSGFKTSSE